MNIAFGKTLKKLRINKGLSQNELADRLFVTRSTIAHWENGNRMPDAAMIVKIAKCLDIDVDFLIGAAAETDKTPNIIILDDEKIILNGGIAVLKDAIPEAEISGFSIPGEALEYAKEKSVDLAFLDIKMGRVSGLDICRKLLDINPKTEIIYLTAYREYSLDAWSTGACGFLLKPLSVDSVREAIRRLPHPIRGINI